MVGKEAGMLGLLLLAASIHEIVSFGAMKRMGFDWSRHLIIRLFLGVISVIWTLYAGWVGMSVPMMMFIYFVIYFACLEFSVENKVYIVNYGLIGFLLYASIFLTFLGVCGIIGNGILDVMASRIFRISILTAVRIVLIPICVLPFEGLPFHGRNVYDSRKLMVFHIFLWCCTLYVAGDSFLCGMSIPGNFIPLLLLSGNLLLCTLIVIFLYHNYLLKKNNYLEREHNRIEAEQAREIYRANYLQELSNKDALTGAYARRYALEMLKAWSEEKRSFSLAYIDLDGLKRINDSGGHAAGDDYLKRFVSEVTGELRDIGTLSRIGGNEFLILFLEIDMDAARQCVESIQKKLECLELPYGPITFSFGIASGEVSIEDLIHKADQEMYFNKRQRKESDEIDKYK